MFLAIWWIWHRMLWAIWPLPSSTGERDRRLADRAWLTLATHFRRAGKITRCDPYANPVAIDVERPKVAALAMKRTGMILKKHSLPGHLMNALLRKLDPEVAAQAKLAEATLAEEQSRRTPVDGSTIPKKLSRGSTIPKKLSR